MLIACVTAHYRRLVAYFQHRHRYQDFRCFALKLGPSYIVGSFAKLRKANISFVISVCVSVRPSVRVEEHGCHWTEFYEVWFLGICRKSVEKIQVSLKSDTIYRYFIWTPISFMITSRSILLIMRNVLDKSCRENQNTFCIQ